MRSLEKKRNRKRSSSNRLQSHTRSVTVISAIILLLSVVMFAGGMSLKEQNDQYIAMENELQAKIDEEKERSAEIDELKEYVGTDEYIESVAKEKLGLAYKNEILFKAE